MTQDLFRQDAYLQDCSAHIIALADDGAVLDRTVFYPLGGGQAGDAGVLVLPDGSQVAISDTRKCKDANGKPTAGVLHVINHENIPESKHLLLNQLLNLERLMQAKATLTARIDWPRRHRMMRFHTATHLLCHVVPQLVNGCSITPDAARMDFSMTDLLDKDALTEALATLVAAALPVTVGSITDAELDANPALIKSMSVSPPRGSGVVRTIRVGNEQLIDLQPCGGTHVANRSEIGHVAVTKIGKKSATTRRAVLGFTA